MRLELGERLGVLSAARENAENVEADSLGEGSALTDDDLVTGLDTESGRDVGGEVLVALLVTGVLGDEVEVLAADDQGACVFISMCCQDQFQHRISITMRNVEIARADVRCILVDMTVPVRIRPRMETKPVKGHFLSM